MPLGGGGHAHDPWDTAAGRGQRVMGMGAPVVVVVDVFRAVVVVVFIMVVVVVVLGPIVVG